MSRYLQVRNWDKFQHYKDRNPPWIKLHTELLDNYEFARLQDASKLLAICIWLLAARSDNKIPADSAWIQRRANLLSKPDLAPLLKAGFIEEIQELPNTEQDASELLAECEQSACSEERRDRDRGEREEARAKHANGKTRRPSRQAPEDFAPDPSVASSRLPDMDVEVEIQKLRDWEFKTPRSNWPAVWRNWVQRCVETGVYAKKANGNGSKPSLRFLTGPEEYELWKQLTADGKHWDTQEQWDEFYRHRVA